MQIFYCPIHAARTSITNEACQQFYFYFAIKINFSCLYNFYGLNGRIADLKTKYSLVKKIVVIKK